MAKADFTRGAASFPLSEGLPRYTRLIPGAARHPLLWRDLPTHARALHAMAHWSGFVVAHTSERAFQTPEGSPSGWFWLAETKTAKASGLLPGIDFSRSGWQDFTTADGIDAEILVLRHEDGDVVWCVHRRFNPPQAGGLLSMAVKADPAYSAFHRAMLVPLPGLTLDDGADDPEDWVGPVPIWIGAPILEDYKAREVFPMLANAPRDYRGRASFRVSLRFARTLWKDACKQSSEHGNRKDGPKWVALQWRLVKDIRCAEGGDAR